MPVLAAVLIVICACFTVVQLSALSQRKAFKRRERQWKAMVDDLTASLVTTTDNLNKSTDNLNWALAEIERLKETPK